MLLSRAGLALVAHTLVASQAAAAGVTCPNTCFDYNCSYWVKTEGFSCTFLEQSCDCTGCACDAVDQPKPVTFRTIEDTSCGIDVVKGGVAIGAEDRIYDDNLPVEQCTDICLEYPGCGGVWYQKSRQRCTYVADTSLNQQEDVWSTCYQKETAEESTSTTRLPKAVATTTQKTGEPSAGGGQCQTGCITEDRSCEDWAEYYTCEELEQKAACACTGCACQVPCDGQWSEWDSCDVTCGQGHKSRNFTVVTPAKDGGKACNFADGDIENMICVVPNEALEGPASMQCPVDCVGHWSAWNDCSVTCGTNGKQTRIFIVESQAKYGGADCPVSETIGCSASTDCFCPANCLQNKVFNQSLSCDDWMATSEKWTCEDLESEHECDCTGCKCEYSPAQSKPNCVFWTCV